MFGKIWRSVLSFDKKEEGTKCKNNPCDLLDIQLASCGIKLSLNVLEIC
jgi:hypothetical protein